MNASTGEHSRFHLAGRKPNQPGFPRQQPRGTQCDAACERTGQSFVSRGQERRNPPWGPWEGAWGELSPRGAGAAALPTRGGRRGGTGWWVEEHQGWTLGGLKLSPPRCCRSSVCPVPWRRRSHGASQPLPEPGRGVQGRNAAANLTAFERCIVPGLSSYDFRLTAACFDVLREMYVQEAAVVQEENTE